MGLFRSGKFDGNHPSADRPAQNQAVERTPEDEYASYPWDHKVFTIGVLANAPREHVIDARVRGLIAVTGGAAELDWPEETIAELGKAAEDFRSMRAREGLSEREIAEETQRISQELSRRINSGEEL